MQASVVAMARMCTHCTDGVIQRISPMARLMRVAASQREKTSTKALCTADP